MKVIITGISSGIGKALTLYYLNQGAEVLGIGRKNTLNHPKLSFFQVDLAEKTDFSFLDSEIKHEDELVLINNAGIIGGIERISQQKKSDILEVMQVNAIAPMLLCQYVLQNTPIHQAISIVNISSGAGKRPIPSWASYCASKTAIDLFSKTIYEEELELGRNVQVYSVAPGVVDTNMQSKIRNAKHASFSSIDHFLKLKKDNNLLNTEEVVQKLMRLLSQNYDGKVIYSLRDF